MIPDEERSAFEEAVRTSSAHLMRDFFTLYEEMKQHFSYHTAFIWSTSYSSIACAYFALQPFDDDLLETSEDEIEQISDTMAALEVLRR